MSPQTKPVVNRFAIDSKNEPADPGNPGTFQPHSWEVSVGGNVVHQGVAVCRQDAVDVVAEKTDQEAARLLAENLPTCLDALAKAAEDMNALGTGRGFWGSVVEYGNWMEAVTGERSRFGSGLTSFYWDGDVRPGYVPVQAYVCDEYQYELVPVRWFTDQDAFKAEFEAKVARDRAAKEVAAAKKTAAEEASAVQARRVQYEALRAEFEGDQQ